MNPSDDRSSDHIKFKSRRGSEVKIQDSQEKTVNLEIKSPKARRKTQACTIKVDDFEGNTI